MSNTNIKTTETARAAYHRNHREISSTLEAIQSKLTANTMATNLEAVNWGHVGDLAKVNADLKAILAFLNN